MNLQLSTREKRERERKLAEVVRESFLADLVTKRYDILKLLCTVESYHLTDLRAATDVFRDARGRKRIGLGNLSTYIKALEGSGLVLKKDREIKASSSAQKIVYAIMEAARPEDEKPWYPQQEEVDLCLEILKTAKTKDVFKVFINELIAILNSGLWDEKLEKFFNDNLKDPENHLSEIAILLISQPRASKDKENFLKIKKEKIYALIEIPDLGSLALRSFVDVNDGKDIIEKFESALYGEADSKGERGDLDVEKAVILLNAAKDYGFELYEKLGPELKNFLRKLLEHESKSVRTLARELMFEIIAARQPETLSQGRYEIA